MARAVSRLGLEPGPCLPMRSAPARSWVLHGNHNRVGANQQVCLPCLHQAVVRDSSVHERVCAHVDSWLQAQGWIVKGLTKSPITGPNGNVEFIIWVGGKAWRTCLLWGDAVCLVITARPRLTYVSPISLMAHALFLSSRCHPSSHLDVIQLTRNASTGRRSLSTTRFTSECHASWMPTARR